MNIRFTCPACERPDRVERPGASSWQCPACGHALTLTEPSGTGRLGPCGVCANAELYRKKDFPHWLGLTILTVACLAFLVTNAIYHQWWAWVILIGSALVDGLLYLWMGDVVVCYRCGAQHRGWPGEDACPPFELGIAERYRQERLRREQLQADNQTRQ